MKIALIGYGKMGKAIESVAQAHEIILRINGSNAEHMTAENLRQADVAIEFSRPEAATANIRTCIDAGLPVVSGTTGWLGQLPEIRNYLDLRGGALLHASNFSLGVNILFALNRMLGRWMNNYPQYAVGIREVHHTAKLDAPSGTAITLAEGLIDELSGKEGWVNEETDDPTLIPIISERIEDVPGTHEVSWDSPIDTLRISHEAYSREGFARGALLAAEWLQDKQGYYTMDDVLDLGPA